ncbi:MAG: hypothetical protein IPP61_08405 [Cytophagaceae bacterium]|nr:hypothetical protein [Cytophagaceae bacterium]
MLKYNFEIESFGNLGLLILFNLPISIIILRQKVFFFSKANYFIFIFFYYFYNGCAVIYSTGLVELYPIYFTIFNYVFGLSYLVFSKISFGFLSKASIIKTFEVLSYPLIFKTLVNLYFFSWFILFLFPENKIMNLIIPPKPNIAENLLNRFNDFETNILSKILTYVITVLYPLILILLYKFRKNSYKIIFFLLVNLYLQYCFNEYIGRAILLTSIIQIILFLWIEREDLRKKLLIIGVFIFPLFVLFSFYYQFFRKDAMDYIEFNSFSKIIEFVVKSETSLPTISKEILNSGKTINLTNYFKWLITLPIPKFGVIKLEFALPSYEMSEIVSGFSRSDQNFNVFLPGFLTESLYVFGKYFFWLNAIFVALILSTLNRLYYLNQKYIMLLIYLVVIVAYNLNRAGIQSVVPIIINHNLLLFFIYFFTELKRLYKFKY